MATFNELLGSQSPGVCWLLEVVNSAGTVTYRYGSQSASYGGNQFDGRIVSMGRLEKSFSTEAIPAAATLALALDNTDGGADWLVDRATVASAVFSARFKLYCGLYDAAALATSQPTLVVRQCGDFVCMDFPGRNWQGQVMVQLVDAALGRLADIAQPPSLNEWAADAGSTTSNCPVISTLGPTVKFGDWDKPVQLAFGERAVPATVAVAAYSQAATLTLHGGKCYPVCATTETGTPSLGDNVNYLYAKVPEAAKGAVGADKIFIPATAVIDGATRTIWSLNRSATIAKGGKNWNIIWIQLYSTYLASWLTLTRLAGVAGAGQWADLIVQGLSLATQTSIYGGYEGAGLDQVQPIYVSGYPWSARTIDWRTRQHPVDIARDLISYYSSASSSDIDTTSFNKARDFNYGLSASGLVQPAAIDSRNIGGFVDSWSQGVLLQTLGDICASSDMELFATWAGKFALSMHANGFEEQTDSLPSLDEERLASVEENIPSLGERWSPYNRLFLDTPGGLLGPFDNATGITTFGRILGRTLKSSWTLPEVVAGYNPWTARLTESTVRPVLKVRTGLDGLRFELGDYLTTSWTRGGGGTPYSGAIFKVDAIAFDPSQNSAELTLVWQGDLRTDVPFLLDSEALLTRVSSGGGRTATVQNSSTTVTFSSGSLVSDGVAAGDFLILKDATQAGSVFSRFRALLIASITDATHLVISDSDLAFGSGAPVAVADWEIRRGYTTYPTSSSDPTNYPNDGAMYGKVADSSGQYTGAVTANKLLNG